MVREMKICPECNSLNVKRVAVGILAVIQPESLKPYEVSGGCCDYGNTPRWVCGDCKHSWGSVIEQILEGLEKQSNNDLLLE